MSPLSDELRKQLGRVIKKARREAEAGGRKALQALAVHHHGPHASMSSEQRTLRNRLRARGRQLGDVRDRVRGTQSIERLVHEVAYEHWHRMLFARFLAENGLLIEPASGVAITMEECEELARERGEDPVTMAARFAQDSLPQIFRRDDPVLEVTLAPETRQALDSLLESLPPAVFTADDSLGWTYQFWQEEKKDEVNRSGVKIGADELPAVTQLFTEHYMVQFLFHNTIGAWRAGKILAENPELPKTAENEDELRRAARLPGFGGYDFEYLRFLRESREGDEEEAPTGPWRPAAGAFEWPKTARELKILDPCCGSGHFLIEGFHLLVRLRVEEEGLRLEDAIRAVLADNLFGLEIDLRCTQIAAFNLAVTAWKLAGHPIGLPPLNIACSGLAVGSTRNEWLTLPGSDERLQAGMARLYDLFRQAPELGSVLYPNSLSGDLLEAKYAELQPFLKNTLQRQNDSEDQIQRAITARGMAQAAEFLSGEYTLVITNVPYLARGKQHNSLKKHLDKFYNLGSQDLATAFLLRCNQYCAAGGTTAIVLPQNWFYQSYYRKLRRHVLSVSSWHLLGWLGPGAFRSISGEIVKPALIVISRLLPANNVSFSAVDATHQSSAEHKASALRTATLTTLRQADQLENPYSRIVLHPSKKRVLLSEFMNYQQGICTGDYPRFGRKAWELSITAEGWELQQGTVGSTTEYGGLDNMVLWEKGWGQLHQFIQAKLGKARVGSWLRGHNAWGKNGIAISSTGTIAVSLYSGELYDDSTMVLTPKNLSHLPAAWVFCASSEYVLEVRKIDKKLNVRGALINVPFDLRHWQKVAAEKYPDGLPEPRSNNPTQWIFHGHPAKAEQSTVLPVTVARLLGYRWPPELAPEMRLADEAREWVERCEELADHADDDGIVCITATRGEASAADRLRRLLAAAFRSDWSVAKERELLAAAAGEGNKPADSLNAWLRDNFFEEHCKLFHHRPFIWHIWDGRRDGFHALVNYHRLAGPTGEGLRTLRALTYSYLGDWIERQRAQQREGKEGADGRLAAALDLQAQLEKILEGEPPYDLFIRWKPLHEQPIGWNPDINDGVRLNIRPFIKAKLLKGGRKGAGILRWKPNIQWTKDRGKDPDTLRPKENFPWFWGFQGDGTLGERTDFTGCVNFDGNRWNDLHYTNEFKKSARERVREEATA